MPRPAIYREIDCETDIHQVIDQLAAALPCVFDVTTALFTPPVHPDTLFRIFFPVAFLARLNALPPRPSPLPDTSFRSVALISR